MRALAGSVLALALAIDGAASSDAASRVDRIRARGQLVCGVAPRLEGFSRISPTGAVIGFEPDLCRAVAAAILGSPAHVRFVAAASLRDFKADRAIDLVARRLTFTLRRDADNGVAFSPTVFHDGATFLVRRGMRWRTPAALAGRRVCVARGSETEAALGALAGIRYRQRRASSAEEAAAAFFAGRCDAWAADLSELAAARARRGVGARAYVILPGMISHEPLALLMHGDDARFAKIVRWTIFALIRAEELGVCAADVRRGRPSPDPQVRTLLGTDPGNGRALGLREDWAANAIRAIGNYGELYERHLGMGGPLRLPRGRNALVAAGGLMEAPPME